MTNITAATMQVVYDGAGNARLVPFAFTPLPRTAADVAVPILKQIPAAAAEAWTMGVGSVTTAMEAGAGIGRAGAAAWAGLAGLAGRATGAGTADTAATARPRHWPGRRAGSSSRCPQSVWRVPASPGRSREGLNASPQRRGCPFRPPRRRSPALPSGVKGAKARAMGGVRLAVVRRPA